MKNIALAFSGGGFRAAAYSLGCLSYLNHLKYEGKPFLENVKYISSTSGGSITNLLYSSFIFKGKNFEEFYNYLNQNLEGDFLLKEALDLLNNNSEWVKRKNKSRNLINAFSLVYDKLLQQEEFGVYNNRDNDPHLEEICVNATEFTNGYPFRFQSQHKELDYSKGYIGNRYIHFKLDQVDKAEKIKLGDILASSTCFPSGFEPMIYPDDYENQKISKKELIESLEIKENKFTLDKYNNIDFIKNSNFNIKGDKQFGIMDGGVGDNQGIDAFIKADNRRKVPFDLFLSCDVSSYLMDGYTLPVYKKRWFDFISINTSIISLIFFMVLSTLLPFITFFLLYNNNSFGLIGTLTRIISFLLLLINIIILCKFIGMVKPKREADSWSGILDKYKSKFCSLSLRMIIQMLLSRAKSVFILANDIYLKQIRRMYYDKLFSEEKYKNRVIQNTIYDLSRVNFSESKPSPNELLPSELVISIAEKARTMGTTLWFDENHTKNRLKESIIAAGQFTTCYNLIRFVDKLPTSELTDSLEDLKTQLVSDWKLFAESPYFLIDILKEKQI